MSGGQKRRFLSLKNGDLGGRGDTPPPEKEAAKSDLKKLSAHAASLSAGSVPLFIIFVKQKTKNYWENTMKMSVILMMAIAVCSATANADDDDWDDDGYVIVQPPVNYYYPAPPLVYYPAPQVNNYYPQPQINNYYPQPQINNYYQRPPVSNYPPQASSYGSRVPSTQGLAGSVIGDVLGYELGGGNPLTSGVGAAVGAALGNGYY